MNERFQVVKEKEIRVVESYTKKVGFATISGFTSVDTCLVVDTRYQESYELAEEAIELFNEGGIYE